MGPAEEPRSSVQGGRTGRGPPGSLAAERSVVRGCSDWPTKRRPLGSAMWGPPVTWTGVAQEGEGLGGEWGGGTAGSGLAARGGAEGACVPGKETTRCSVRLSGPTQAQGSSAAKTETGGTGAGGKERLLCSGGPRPRRWWASVPRPSPGVPRAGRNAPPARDVGVRAGDARALCAPSSGKYETSKHQSFQSGKMD